MLGKKLLRDNGAISRWDPQLFHELRNREGERGEERERSARINEKLDAKCPVISTSAHNFFYRFFYDSMRGERESGKSARIIISSQREREREGGRFKRDGEIRCASIMPVSRELSRDRLLTCWNTRVAIGDYMIGVI